MSYQYEDNLKTERIITRNLIYDDYKIWTTFFDDKESVQFFPTFGLKTSEERAKVWIEKQLTRYEEKRYGLQALIDKETGDFIGQSGLLLQNVDGINELEVGYHLFKNYRGKGYAYEIAHFFKEYAFSHNLCDSLVSIIHIDNIKSQQVAQRNGMKRDKTTLFFDNEHIVYRIFK